MKVMKRALTMLLVLTMLLGTFAMSVGAETVSVTFDANGGADHSGNTTYTDVNAADRIASNKYKIVWGAEMFNAPEGYHWSAWALGADEYIVGDEVDVPVGTLTAVWEPNEYTITYVDEDGSVLDTQTVKYNDEYELNGRDDVSKSGYLLTAWKNGETTYAPGAPSKYTTTSDLILTAVWEEITSVPATPIVPSTPAPAVGTKISNAVTISCGEDHHDAISYPYYVTKDSDMKVVLGTDKNIYCYITLSDTEISTYIAKYNADTYGKHAAVNRNFPEITLVYKMGWCGPEWKGHDDANITTSCDCDHCHDWCGGWWHKHTVTYTDGVRGDVVFKDITYTVKHGGKTPVPATPVRAGYKFAGWTPAVSAKTTSCATYTATWTAVNAPALTTKHVAYLKGYGGGLVKPEGNITRAEAITMLYRLMDAASVKEYYTSYNAFSDVAKDAWYNDAVSTLANAGVLAVKTGTLNPNEKITRAEFFYMLTKFSNASYTGKVYFVDVPADYWAYEELALAQYLGWIKGYGGGILYPDATITRAEVAATLNRVLDRDDCKTKDTKNFTDNPVNAWYYQDIVEASIAH